MKRLGLLLLTVTACSAPTTTDELARAEAQAAQGRCREATEAVAELRARGLAAPDVQALQARVDADDREIAALKMQMAKAPKIPHLIAYAGSGEEVDLGPFVDWQHAYSAKLNQYYYFGSGLYFTSTDCTGKPMITDENNGGPEATADGRIVIASPPFQLVNYQSAILYTDPNCRNADQGVMGKISSWTITDTGEKAGLYLRRILSAELR